jgi:hypothetical protein
MNEEIWNLISLLYSIIAAYCLEKQLKGDIIKEDTPALIIFSFLWPTALLIGGLCWLDEKISKKN